MKLVGTFSSMILIFIFNDQVNGLNEGNEKLTSIIQYKNGTIGKADAFILPITPIKGFKLEIPKECENLNICESIQNYPLQFVIRVIELLYSKNIKLNMDPLPEVSTFSMKNEEEAPELCASKPRAFIPLAARHSDNKWHLVLNSEKYPQVFVGEVCELDSKNHYESCSKIASFPNNYRGICKQKHIKRKMMALDEGIKNVVEIIPDFPSCCSCSVVREKTKTKRHIAQRIKLTS